MGSFTESKLLLGSFILLALYFFWMDAFLYQTLQNKEKSGAIKSTRKTKDYTPTPFTDVTLKLAMSDHWVHFIYMPSAELFEATTNFTSHLPWVSANMVSFTHLGISLVCGKFLMSDSLQVRRLGIFFFYIRNWLDAFDGVVFRAHAHTKHAFKSVHGSLGYLVDAVTDIMATAILFFALLFWLKRNVSRLCKESQVLPFNNKIGLTEKGIGLKPMPEVVTGKTIFFKLLWIGFIIILSSACWDKFYQEYGILLESSKATPPQQILQLEVLKSGVMWMFIWSWKVFNAQGIIEIFLIIVIFDKVWEAICWMQYVLPVIVLVLAASTEIHLHSEMAYIGHVPAP